jgi:hypothetical protein
MEARNEISRLQISSFTQNNAASNRSNFNNTNIKSNIVSSA